METLKEVKTTGLSVEMIHYQRIKFVHQSSTLNMLLCKEECKFSST